MKKQIDNTISIINKFFECFSLHKRLLLPFYIYIISKKVRLHNRQFRNLVNFAGQNFSWITERMQTAISGEKINPGIPRTR